MKNVSGITDRGRSLWFVFKENDVYSQECLCCVSCAQRPASTGRWPSCHTDLPLAPSMGTNRCYPAPGHQTYVLAKVSRLALDKAHPRSSAN